MGINRQISKGMLSKAIMGVTGCISLCWSLSAWALMDAQRSADSFHTERIHLADSKKTNAYIKEGLVNGGDQAIQDVIIKDIRHSKNSEFERIVIDIEGNRNGEPAAIPRPPYFQVSSQSRQKRLILTFWGRPSLLFDAKKILNTFKRSSNIQHVNLFPRIEDDRWTMVMETSGGSEVEVFELSQPVRVIVDIRHKEN